MSQKHLTAISDYINRRSSNPDTWLIHSRNQSDLMLAIQTAAFSINHQAKRHPHQYRIKKVNLQLFTDNLTQVASNLQVCRTFDELINLVASCKVRGIGELTIYDTAHRIGMYLHLEPDHIYIHAGTKIGLEKLRGRTTVSKMSKECLPEPFKSSALSPAELEDFFCHMRGDDLYDNGCFKPTKSRGCIS